MIEIKIPKEIRQYESTFVGGLSFRKTISIGLGGIFVSYIGFTFKGAIPVDLIVLLSLLIGVPFGLFGFVNLYGMTFEKFIKVAFNDNIRSSKIRKYIVKNTLEKELKLIDSFPDETETQEEADKRKKKKNKKNKKKKYKKSKQAIK